MEVKPCVKAVRPLCPCDATRKKKGYLIIEIVLFFMSYYNIVNMINLLKKRGNNKPQWWGYKMFTCRAITNQYLFT